MRETDTWGVGSPDGRGDQDRPSVEDDGPDPGWTVHEEDGRSTGLSPWVFVHVGTKCPSGHTPSLPGDTHSTLSFSGTSTPSLGLLSGPEPV